MQTLKSFPAEVIDKIGYYVYRLIDPRNGETFYVGKGKGNRVFDHLKAYEKTNKTFDEKEEFDTQNDPKLATIKSVVAAGLEVIIVIHRHGIEDEATAYLIEAALIDVYPSASNRSIGRGSSEYGVMNVKEVLDKYTLPEAEFKHDVLMININITIQDENLDIYDATRYCWRLNKNKAEKAQYILAIEKGIIKEVFVADAWLEATLENFPTFNNPVEGRFGFIGKEAPKEIRNHYINKRIPDCYRKKGAANPIKYSY